MIKKLHDLEFAVLAYFEMREGDEVKEKIHVVKLLGIAPKELLLASQMSQWINERAFVEATSRPKQTQLDIKAKTICINDPLLFDTYCCNKPNTNNETHIIAYTSMQ